MQRDIAASKLVAGQPPRGQSFTAQEWVCLAESVLCHTDSQTRA
jgi:hypothetical protein